MASSRTIIQTSGFAKKIDRLIAERKVVASDFEALKICLVKDPELGDLISGTGGIRKVRLKSSTKGKSGGFRVCYFDDPEQEEIFLMQIYAKNEQANISPDEKKELKKFAEMVKRR